MAPDKQPTVISLKQKLRKIQRENQALSAVQDIIRYVVDQHHFMESLLAENCSEDAIRRVHADGYVKILEALGVPRRRYERRPLLN